MSRSYLMTGIIDVLIEYDDFERARESAIKAGRSTDILSVPAEVDIDEALEHATVEQLRDALGRQDCGYTQDQLRAVRDAFEAAVAGDIHTASALLGRAFEYDALIAAAEQGLAAIHERAAA